MLTKLIKTDVDYLIKNGFWTTLNQVITGLLTFVTTIAFANLISADTYGTYKFILSIASFLAIPTLSGLNTSLVRAIAQNFDGNINLSIKLKLIWGLLGYVGGICIGLYYLTVGNVNLGVSILCATAFIPFMELGSLYTAILHGHKKFKVAFIYDFLLLFIITTITLVTIFITDNIVVLTLVYFFSWSAGRLILLYLVQKSTHQRNTFISLESISLGKHLSLIKISNTVASNIDKIIIFNLLGPASVAVYTIALAPIQQIKSFASVIKIIGIPKLSDSNFAMTPPSYLYKLSLLSFGLTLITILYVLCVPILFNLFFPAYLDAIPLTQILALGIAFTGYALNGAILIARNGKQQLYIQTSITYAFQITFSLLGGFYFGVLGIAWSFVATQMIYLFLSTFGVLTVLKNSK